MDLINVEPDSAGCTLALFRGYRLQKLRFSIAGASSQLPPIINCVILPLSGGIGDALPGEAVER